MALELKQSRDFSEPTVDEVLSPLSDSIYSSNRSPLTGKSRASRDRNRKFYEALRRNKAIVVPKDGEEMERACRLDIPCFSIIEEPLVNRRGRKNGEAKKDEKSTEISSKIERMSIINLMWNITECGIK
jgi:hypothetical protein